MKYKQQLDDMNRRVKSRPLLLEQAGATKCAMKPSVSDTILALKKSGLSEDDIQKLLEAVNEES